VEHIIVVMAGPSAAAVQLVLIKTCKLKTRQVDVNILQSTSIYYAYRYCETALAIYLSRLQQILLYDNVRLLIMVVLIAIQRPINMAPPLTSDTDVANMLWTVLNSW